MSSTRKDRSSQKSWAARLAVLVVASFGAIVALEATIRAVDLWGVSYFTDVTRYFNEAIVVPPEAGHAEGHLFEHAPGRRIEFETFRWRTDERGLRIPFAEVTPEPAETTILFLGDSVTLAWGVDARAAWIERVERTLDVERPGGVECLNAGHLRYDTAQAAGYLAAKGDALEPDLVVLTFVTNDLEDSWEIYREVAALLAAPPPSGLDAWRGRAREWTRGLRNAASVVEQKRKDARIEPVADATVLPGYADDWARCEAALERLLAGVDALGAKLVVLDHSQPAVPDLVDWCNAHGVPCTDFRFTDEEWTRGITNSVADKHANALGNELLAAKALPVLRAVL
ncbi:MAG: SGNH/GDSL hydrolase family protein [Planctomycetota bacterium]